MPDRAEITFCRVSEKAETTDLVRLFFGVSENEGPTPAEKIARSEPYFAVPPEKILKSLKNVIGGPDQQAFWPTLNAFRTEMTEMIGFLT